MKMSGRLALRAPGPPVWKLPIYARVIWGLVRDPRTPLPLKGLLAAGLAYVVMPLDLIPDAIPIIGQADDLTVLLLVLDLFIANAPADVREEQIERAHNGTADLDQDLARLRRAAGDAVTTRSAIACRSCWSATATCATRARSRRLLRDWRARAACEAAASARRRPTRRPCPSRATSRASR